MAISDIAAKIGFFEDRRGACFNAREHRTTEKDNLQHNRRDR